MKRKISSFSGIKHQRGYLMIVAVVLIVVIGFLGIAVSYMTTGSATSTINNLQSAQALYLAESGLEQSTRRLLTSTLSNRITCTGLSVSNSLGAGTYSTTSTGPYLVSSPTTLNGAITSSATTIPVLSTSNYQSAGRIMIDHEFINYSSVNSTNFLGVTRGVDGATAASHASGARVAQYQCNLSSQGGAPSLSPSSTTLGGKRTLTQAVQLQEGWAAGATLSGPTNWNIRHWNTPTEKAWTAQAPAIASPKVLNGVSIVSNVDAWIVGNSGIALHYTGSSWANVNTGITTGNNTLSVSAVSATEAWACDNKGKVYKWSGGASWTNPFSPGDSTNGISVLDTNGDGVGNVGWVVGTKKSAFLYNGSTWTATNTGVSQDLNSVSTVSATDAWAAGQNGKIFQWTGGSSWATISTPSASPNLNSISMIRSGGLDTGWAVGTSSTAWFFNGSSWSSLNTGLAGGLTINGVVTISSNEAWLVASGGQLYEWNGSNWTLIATAGAGLNAIDMLHPSSKPFSAWAESF